MMDEKTYHLINDYLSGELSGRALDNFKAELNINTELQEQVALQKTIIKGLTETREAELKAYITEHTAKKGVVFFTPAVRMALASAAAIALVVSAFFVFKNIQGSGEETLTNTRPVNTEDTTPVVKENKISAIDSLQLQDTQLLAIEEVIPLLLEDIVDDAEIVNDEEVEKVKEEEEEESIPEVYKPETDELDKETKEPALDDATDGVEKVSTSDKDFDIKSDKLISNRNFLVYSINPNINAYQNDVEVAETTSTSGKTTREAKKEAKAKAEEDNNKSVVISTRNINVEYWKSVVNYKGYNYNGGVVKFYGVEKDKSMDFKELESRLYVKMNGKQYFIEKNRKYNRLTEVTNPTLLKVLND